MQSVATHGTLFSRPLLFWIGVVAILAGVSTHLPMFGMMLASGDAFGKGMAGMPMSLAMKIGMGGIVGGAVLAFWGLMPRPNPAHAVQHAQRAQLELHGIDDGPLTRRHWQLLGVLTIAIVVDVMKPATLGFIVPGMSHEYGLSRQIVTLFPLAALVGTTLGSVIWGGLADVFGRRASILLSALMFIGTSICGAMPTFAWNVVMCFLMGLAAGGLLPIAFTLLAEIVPTRHRGWSMVLVGAVGTAGGYLAATANAALMEPLLTWRGMWLAGVPTGLTLILLNRYFPESPRFLWMRGRFEEARRSLEAYGIKVIATTGSGAQSMSVSWADLLKPPLRRLTLALGFCGVAWGLVNFGFLLWLPANLRAAGFDMGTTNIVLARSALIAFPVTLLVAWMYHRWSSKWTLVFFTGLTAAALVGFVTMGTARLGASTALLTALIVTLLVGSAGVIAALLPYGTEIFPLAVRGRGAGTVAASSKLGGVVGIAVSGAALIASLGAAALVAAIPVALAALALAWLAIETRGQALEDISRTRVPEVP